MPKVVTFTLFLGLSISSFAVWASAQLHQEDNTTASIFFIASSLSGIRSSAPAFPTSLCTFLSKSRESVRRARRERPRHHCPNEKADELAPPHGAYPKAKITD